MTRAERARVAAAAIAPATVAGLALIRCRCSQAAWAIEIATPIIFSLWIVASRPEFEFQFARFCKYEDSIREPG